MSLDTTDYKILNCLCFINDHFPAFKPKYSRKFMKFILKTYGEQKVISLVNPSYHKFLFQEIDFLKEKSSKHLSNTECENHMKKVQLQLMNYYLKEVGVTAEALSSYVKFPSEKNIKKGCNNKLQEIKNRVLHQFITMESLEATSESYKEIERLLSDVKDYYKLYYDGELSLDCLKEYYSRFGGLMKYDNFISELEDLSPRSFNSKLRTRLNFIKSKYLKEENKKERFFNILKEEYETMLIQLKSFNDVMYIGNYQPIQFEEDRYLECFLKYLGYTSSTKLKEELDRIIMLEEIKQLEE